MFEFLKDKTKAEEKSNEVKATYGFLIMCYQDPDDGGIKFSMQSNIYENLFEKYPKKQATELKVTYNMLEIYLQRAIDSVKEWYISPFDAEKVKTAFQFGDRLPSDIKLQFRPYIKEEK
jgi:hypothetical protein